MFTPKSCGLLQNAELLIDESIHGVSGVDLPTLEEVDVMIGVAMRSKIGLPEMSEPQVIRHFVRLSRMNYSIDAGFYPLGSCTMKHNPRINEKLARLDGFANIHPMQDESSVQGALQLIYELQEKLMKITGMRGISISPAAGAHGEFAGISVIRAAHLHAGESRRKIVLIPDSAHGTNPATAAMCGYEIKVINSNKEDGTIDFDHFKSLVAEHGKNIAATMITNPNTCGKFEKNIKKIADLIHSVGAYFYCDGANFNAIVGKVRPADFGVDVMHLNLHKTFSTPHGGGGPGCGPIVVCEALKKFLPAPVVKKNGEVYSFFTPEFSIGRIKAFHGQFGMMVRAFAYILSHGRDGLKKVAEDSVLSANYILKSLENDYHVPFEGYCMHECLLTDKIQKKSAEITTMDIAKSLIEYGYHPMTTFFPLVVSGAMLIEPTETETKQTIDGFINTMLYIAREVESGNGEKFHDFPHNTPISRVDDVLAAKNPILTWSDINLPQN